MDKRLPIVPKNCQRCLLVGSADVFKKNLEKSVFVDAHKASKETLKAYEDKDSVILGSFSKNEFWLIHKAADFTHPVSAPMIHGEIIRPASGNDLVKVSFQPNPYLNKALYAAIQISDLMFIAFLIASLFPGLGISSVSAGLISKIALILTIFARATLHYMKTKFPPDAFLVEHVRQIAASTRSEVEDKPLIDGGGG
ncbi:MAG: hypothetical protein K2Y39_09665 [Candidatus Obscuribacterales bacterium]|nr:hypothetical protein [Candidatus Obscuribacterales bacterium]